MDTVKEMGWTRIEKKDYSAAITDNDIKSVFKLVDINKSGTICKIVSKYFRKQSVLKKE
jgi:hypothetical protein